MLSHKVLQPTKIEERDVLKLETIQIFVEVLKNPSFKRVNEHSPLNKRPIVCIEI